MYPKITSFIRDFDHAVRRMDGYMQAVDDCEADVRAGRREHKRRNKYIDDTGYQCSVWLQQGELD